MKRVKDSTTERAEILDEIIAVLKDNFICKFTFVGEVAYMTFDDGDRYAFNLVKCNNLIDYELTDESEDII